MLLKFFKKKEEKESPIRKELRFYNLKVKEVIKETTDAVTIVFDSQHEKIDYQSGQFLTLIVSVKGKKLRRAYSLCTSPLTDSDLAVTVKKEPKGVVSAFLNEKLKQGDELEVMEPMGAFVLKGYPEKQRHIILFAGGSGITPLFSMAKTALASELRTRVTLIYSSRNEDSIIFKKQIDYLSNQYGGRFEVEYVLTKPSDNWTGVSGRIDSIKVDDGLNKYHWQQNEDYEFFICGPDGLMDCVITALHQKNVPEEKIHKESFVPGNTSDKEILLHESIDSELQTQEVSIILDGEEHKYLVPPDKNILEVGLGLDIDLPYSCRSGICTSCRGKAISGKVKMDETDGLSQEELAEGYVLTCQSHPLTSDVVIEIG